MSHGVPKPYDPKSLSRRKLLAHVGFAGLAALTGEALLDTNWFEVTHHHLRLSSWQGPKVRLAVLSDLHFYETADVFRGIEAVEAAVHQKPDILLLPGDFLSSSGADYIVLLRQFLREIAQFKVPSFACMGNHDANCGQPYWLVKEFQDSMTRMLINETAEWEGITIAGLDDAIHGRPHPETVFSGEYSRSNRKRPVITLSHEPDYASQLDYGLPIVLSGHTHGGQICLPFGVPVHLPIMGKNFVQGWYPGEKTPMYVGRGIGTVGLPVRVFCRPEIAILDLESA